METIKFKAVVDSEYFNNPPHLRIHYDNKILADFPVTNETTIEKDLLVKDDSRYKLNFTLYDKSKYDTIVKNGSIVNDTLLKIKDIELDDVSITSMLSIDQENFYYIHDGSDEKHIFYDTMGINGTSTVEFSTPFYQWLLETL